MKKEKIITLDLNKKSEKVFKNKINALKIIKKLKKKFGTNCADKGILPVWGLESPTFGLRVQRSSATPDILNESLQNRE